MGPVPLGRSCGEGKVLSPRKLPSPAGRSARTEGSFRGSEESAAAGLWQEKHRYTSMEGPGWPPVLLSPRCTYAGTCQGWVLQLWFQRTEPGRGMGLMCGPSCNQAGGEGCAQEGAWVSHGSLTVNVCNNIWRQGQGPPYQSHDWPAHSKFKTLWACKPAHLRR